MSLLDYGMCCERVTLYRRRGGGVHRVLLDNCYLQDSTVQKTDLSGQTLASPFLLIVPGQEQLVFPGDRICRGTGPVVEQWQDTASFLQVEYAKPFVWMGQFCHTEAGRKE